MIYTKAACLNHYCHSVENNVDCQIMHMKDISETVGLPLSGEMCFGLSEAYDFSYWYHQNSRIPCLIMLGRTLEAMDTFFRKIGIQYQIAEIQSESDFKEYIQQKISDQHISLVYSDRYYLRYLEQKYNRAHFGNHMIAVKGWRESDCGTEYAVCDVTSNEDIWCKSSDIQLARSSSWKPFSPDCRVVDVNLNSNNAADLKANFSKEIISSIKRVADRMLTSTNSGVAAINALSSEIKYLLNCDLNRYGRAISFQMRLIASFISEFEETHSFYRMTYAGFLNEAACYDGLQFLFPFSNRMETIARQWIAMSKLVSSELEISELLNKFSDGLKEAAMLETVFFEDLKCSLHMESTR